MSAILQLAELIITTANTSQAIATAVVKEKIKSYINQHKQELSILRQLHQYIYGSSDIRSLNNQLEQYQTFLTSTWQNLTYKFTKLSQIQHNEVKKKKFDNIKVPSTSIKTYMSIGKNVMKIISGFMKFMMAQTKINFGGIINPKKQLHLAFQTQLLKPVLLQYGISSYKTEYLISQYEKGFRKDTSQKISFKQLINIGSEYYKDHKLQALGTSMIMTARVVLFALNVYGFIQGFGTLQNLDSQFKQVKEAFGLGGTLEQSQEKVLLFLSTTALDISNTLYESYSIIQEIQNIFSFLKASLPMKYHILEKESKVFEVQKFVKGFTNQFIEKIAVKTSTIYNHYIDAQKKIKKAVQKGHLNRKRQIIKQTMKTIKKEFQQLNVGEDGQKLINVNSLMRDLAKKFRDLSIATTLMLESYIKQVSNSKEFWQQCTNKFYRRQKKQKTIQRQSSLLKTILGQYNRWFINPNIPAYKKLPHFYDKQDSLEESISQTEKYDSFIKENIVQVVSSFTDKFYYDDQTGSTLFGKKITDGTQKQQFNVRKAIPNVIYHPNTFKHDKQSPKTSGYIISMSQFEEKLISVDKRFDPLQKDKKVKSMQRCTIVNNFTKEITVLQTDTTTKKMTPQKKKINYLVFNRGMIFTSVPYGKNGPEELYQLAEIISQKGQKSWMVEKVKS